MTVGIFGGRFDPPHLGHLWVAKQILSLRPDIAEIWFMPAAKHQWKPTVAGPKNRMEMLGFLTNERIKVSDLEIQRGGISYTIDTVRHIKEKFGHTIYLIIGSDIPAEFDRWEKTQDLTQLATFLIFPRDPYAIAKTLPQGFEILSDKTTVTTNLSSTLIRERIKKGLPVVDFLPEKVYEYIEEKKLYR